MRFAPAWARLPGPSDFIRTVVGDLRDGNIVFVGLPNSYPEHIALEVAEAFKLERLGIWSTVGSKEARTTSPQDSIDARAVGDRNSRRVIWVNAKDNETASSWINFANSVAGADTTPSVCIAMAISRAEKCNEEKRLRRRLWQDFVSPMDSRVIAERHCRQSGRSRLHTELKCALITELAGANLSEADLMSKDKLSKLLDTNKFDHKLIWAAQVSVLFPLVDRERRRLLEQYHDHWDLPHDRSDGRKIYNLDEFEIGDMYIQAKRKPILKLELKRINWLRRMRNELAHYKAISWGSLMLPIALEIADFRK